MHLPLGEAAPVLTILQIAVVVPDDAGSSKNRHRYAAAAERCHVLTKKEMPWRVAPLPFF
jgi:hypothetical protein